ncbi:MAG: InlB B-repeat-containing protein [Bacteroidales bacterium]
MNKRPSSVRRSLFALFLFAALFFPYAATTTASSPGDLPRTLINLELLVTDIYDNPIENAVVFVENEFSTQTVTNPLGITSYSLPPGTYQIFSYAADYLDSQAEITLTQTDASYNIRHNPAVYWSTSPANAPIGVGEKNGVRMAAADGKLYLWAAYGGQPGTTQYGGLTDFYKYDPSNDTWTQLPNAPFSSSYGISTAYGKNMAGQEAIYIIKGYWSGQRTWFARFNTLTQQWENSLNHNIPWRTDLGNQYNGTNFQNYPRNGAVMVYVPDGHMYLLPGSAYSYEKYDWYRYSIATDKWEALEALPHKQGPGNAAAWVGAGGAQLDQDYIYVQFGITPSGNYTGAEFWRYGLSSQQWEKLPDHGYGADDGSMLVWDGQDHLYHSPGAWAEQSWDQAHTQKRQFMRYSISKNLWEEMEKTPYNRWGGWDDAGGMVIIDNIIYAMKGGDDVAWAENQQVSGGGDIPSNQLWKYTLNPDHFQLKVLEPQGLGTTSIPSGNQMIPSGTSFEISATPLTGWQFEKWTINETYHCYMNPTTIVMDENKTVMASFLQTGTHTQEITTDLLPGISFYNQQLHLHLPAQGGWLSIYDTYGRNIKNTGFLSQGDHSYSFDFPPGIYITRLIYGSQVFSSKIRWMH